MTEYEPIAPGAPRSPLRVALTRVATHPYLLLSLAALFWSGNHIVGRAVAGHVPPLAMSTLRWALPAVALWYLARPYLAADWPAMKRHWRIMLFLGVTGGGLFSAGQYVGLQYTTALNVSVLNSLSPVFIVAAGAALFRDRLTAIQGFGIAVSLVGVLAIVARGHIETLRHFDFNWGDLLIVFNMAIWAIYSVYLRWRPQVHWLSFTFVFAIISSLCTLPLTVFEFASGFHLQPTVLTAFALLYICIFPSVLAFTAWMRGVEAIGANRAGVFVHLVPLFSALLASVFLGEHLAAFHIVGFALILAGVWCTARSA